jgi:hypothetical protein
MKHYRAAQGLMGRLEELVKRHPITQRTARLWFEAAHELAQIAFRIRLDAWRAMSRSDKELLRREDPALDTLARYEEAED